MMSGIFFVQFSVDSNNAGTGLAVFNKGDINGGDDSYLYRGYLDTYNTEAKATIEVTHYKGPRNSVFGLLDSFTLDLVGSADDQFFNVRGSISGTSMPTIQITGRKVAQLYERGT